jgi:hypothetical protein
MLVMHLCIRCIDVDLVFACLGYRCCLMYLCVRGIDVDHAFVC